MRRRIIGIIATAQFLASDSCRNFFAVFQFLLHFSSIFSLLCGDFEALCGSLWVRLCWRAVGVGWAEPRSRVCLSRALAAPRCARRTRRTPAPAP